MAKPLKKSTKTISFAVVAMVRTETEADEYQKLLSTNNIPVKVKKHNSSEQTTNGFEVMVPEDYLDEAYVVIESSDSYEDFYDFAMEDEDDDFNDDFFDGEDY